MAELSLGKYFKECDREWLNLQLRGKEWGLGNIVVDN